MKSSTKKIILWSVVIVLLLAAVIVLCWYHSPGVHVLGPFARVDISEQCYIMDLDTGEVLEKSWLAVRVDGNLRTQESSGVARVDGYPVKGDASTGMSGKPNDMLIHHSGWMHTSDDEGLYEGVPSQYSYVIYIVDGLTFVLIADSVKGVSSLAAVCASTPEEASRIGEKIVDLVYTPET